MPPFPAGEGLALKHSGRHQSTSKAENTVASRGLVCSALRTPCTPCRPIRRSVRSKEIRFLRLARGHVQANPSPQRLSSICSPLALQRCQIAGTERSLLTWCARAGVLLLLPLARLTFSKFLFSGRSPASESLLPTLVLGSSGTLSPPGELQGPL